jgi:hypothetical protein
MLFFLADARAEILDALSMLSHEKIHQDLGLVQILAELAQHGKYQTIHPPRFADSKDTR